MSSDDERRLSRARDLFDQSIAVKAATRNACTPALVASANACIKSLAQGGKLMLAGNGGSAADAQHLAAECLGRLRPNVNRRAIPAIALALDTSTLTANANDFGYEKIYARALEGLGRAGDVFIGITTSGQSANILNALQTARDMGITTIGFLGSGGGSALALCDHAIVIPSNEVSHIQEAHITAGHVLIELIEDELLAQGFL